MSTRTRYFLDTNVLSETRKKLSDAQVLAFLSNATPTALYLSCLSLGELEKGVALKMKADPVAAKAIAKRVTTVLLNARRGSEQYHSVKSRMACSYDRRSSKMEGCLEPLIWSSRGLEV